MCSVTNVISHYDINWYIQIFPFITERSMGLWTIRGKVWGQDLRKEKARRWAEGEGGIKGV